MKTYQRGGYFNQSQTFHPFYQPEQIKKEELDKILEADSIADDSTIQNAFYDAPTVVYLFAPYTYPNDAQDCCVAKSFTIRQNKPKNPGEICELLEVKQTSAYEIIGNLNKELEEQGYLTLRGKVPTKYFVKRFYGVGPASDA